MDHLEREWCSHRRSTSFPTHIRTSLALIPPRAMELLFDTNTSHEINKDTNYNRVAAIQFKKLITMNQSM